MKRLLVYVAVVSAVLAVAGVPACGKKSTQPRTTTTTASTVPLTNGTWETTVTLTATSGGSACATMNNITKDTLIVSHGMRDFFGDGCNYTITGNSFSHACADTTVLSPDCRAIVSYSGSGGFTATTFSGNFTIVFKNDPAACSGGSFPECVFSATISGRRIGAAPQAAIRPMDRGEAGLVERLLRGR